MKNLALSVFCLFVCGLSVSGAAFAQEQAQVDPIFNPQIDGIPFSGESDANGVCIALGYEKLAPSVYRHAVVHLHDAPSGVFALNTMADGHLKGEITRRVGGGIYSGIRASVYGYIACLNQRNEQPLWSVQVFTSPQDAKRSNPYSAQSSALGICKSQGYDFFAEGSHASACMGRFSLLDNRTYPRSIIDDTGSVIGTEMSRCQTAHVMCYKPRE